MTEYCQTTRIGLTQPLGQVMPQDISRLLNARAWISYAEQMKNIRRAFNVLTAQNNEIVLSPKVDDEIANSIPNAEEDIRDAIAKHLRKLSITIDGFLSHSEYISEDTLNTLAELKMEKDFFDEAQKPKRALMKYFRHEGLSDGKITAKISSAILDMQKEFCQTERIDKKKYVDSRNREPDNVDEQKKNSSKFKPLRYWNGTKNPPQDKQIILDEIIAQLLEIAKRFTSYAKGKNTEQGKVDQEVKTELIRLAKFYHQIVSKQLQKGGPQQWEN
jgi:hypothetical protein